MKTRLPFVLFMSLALVAVLAACGGGGSGGGDVPSDSIAKVGSTPITKADFNAALNYVFADVKAQGQPVPKVGTPQYTQLRDNVVRFLVSSEELAQEADKLGVSVSQKDIDKQINMITTRYYKGDKSKLLAALKKDGITLKELEQYNIQPNVLSTKLEDKVTSSVKVSDADAQKYYNQNKASFSTPETREVRHILVNSKSLAQQIETKLKNGASFATLAKKYSKDTGSAAQGGKLCVAHVTATQTCITTVAPFDKASFSLKTNEISQPVHSKFGWHIIQPVGPIQPAHTQTFKELESQIKGNLAQQQKQVVWQNWELTKLAKDYKGKVAYATGYAPATTTTPTAPAQTGSATTTG